MNHLSEEKLIDLLFEETTPADNAHLRTCEACRERYDVLRSGLSAARAVVPPELPMQLPISARFYARRRMRWVGWAAAAALIVMAIAGTRIEFGQGTLRVQFAMAGLAPEMAPTADLNEQLEQAESEFLDALQMHAAVMQMQVDDRFNAFYAEQMQQMNELSRQVEDDIKSVDYQNGSLIASLRDDVYEYLQTERIKGRTP